MNIVITLLICSGILFLFYLSVKNNSTRNYKNEIVSLGIFGTFVGIMFGLFVFDSVNIKDSIPVLLDGLKIAFITSALGVFISIIISIIKPGQNTNVTLADISNNQVAMISVLDKSLTRIASTANEEIIRTLEDVVEQFNENLTVQFGQNFKELNHAVKNMIVWQENYKGQILAVEKGLSEVVENLSVNSEKYIEQEKHIESLMTEMSSTSRTMLVKLEDSSEAIHHSLQGSTNVVKESLHLLLREANGRL